MKTNIKNLDELEILVSNFLGEITQKKSAYIVALSGDLGVGKTAFVKAAARYFSLVDDITSPTFVIQKEYDIINHSFIKKMIHIDAYRLKNKSELEYLKWSESIKNSTSIIFIEWPEQVSGINMPHAININMEILDDESREINII